MKGNSDSFTGGSHPQQRQRTAEEPSAEASSQRQQQERQQEQQQQHQHQQLEEAADEDERQRNVGGGGSGSGGGGAYNTLNASGHPDLLHLFMGAPASTTGTRLSFDCLEYLCVRDVVNAHCASRRLRAGLQRVDYTKSRDSRNYRVPFPGYPGLLPEEGAGLFPHQLASLRAMHRAENASTEYGSLRGGILGDAPGLGKTVTALALVASTAGRRVVNPPGFWDQNRIDEGWERLRTNVMMGEDVSRLFRPVRAALNDDEYGTFRKLLIEVQPPYKPGVFPTIRDFERHAVARLRKVVEPSVVDLFRDNVRGLMAGLDTPKGRRAAAGRRLGWERTLKRTSATLIVVPDALLEHWSGQIKQHLNLVVFSDSTAPSKASATSGIVYLDGVGDLDEVLNSELSLQNISVTRAPLSVNEFSRYTIVLTTFSRIEKLFKEEVSNGRMEGLGQQQRGTKRSRRTYDAVDSSSDSTTLRQKTPMLRMRWLRLIVDEGHELGTREVGNAVTRFVNAIPAERRWVLSGTPTTGDEDDPNYVANALDQLQRLLFFLRHPKYGTIPPPSTATGGAVESNSDRTGAESRGTIAKTLWESNVKVPFLSPFLERKEEGRDELLRVLKEVMVLHRKEDIQLPIPIFRQIENYVQIPEAIEIELQEQHAGPNLVAKFDEYLHSQQFQSSVDDSQARYIVRAIGAARKALMKRGGPLSGTGTALREFRSHKNGGETSDDRRPVKAVVYSVHHNVLLSVAEQVIRLIGSDRVAELYETHDISDTSAELARFRTGDKEYRTCPLCSRPNSCKSSRCTNSLMEVVSTAPPYARFLIEPERIQHTVDVEEERMGGELMESYPVNARFWQPDDLLLVNVREGAPGMTPRQSESTWVGWGSRKCQELALKDGYQGPDWYFGPLPASSSEDAIEVRLVKWQECGKFHRSSWYKGPRLVRQPVQKEKHDTQILMLHADLSDGLDLSFVTHMFLLEPIADAAKLEQVTSRAHRLGATGPVTVETVNVFYKASPALDQALSGALLQDVKKTLLKEVCEHCYRGFDSKEAAIEHERSNCPRNPDNFQRVDPFHLSSVYREVRPPPALQDNDERDDDVPTDV